MGLCSAAQGSPAPSRATLGPRRNWRANPERILQNCGFPGTIWGHQQYWSWFGRPYCWLGFEFGTGLVVSSLMFGIVHGLNTVDYFHGRFEFGWRMAIQSVLAGIFYGLM